MKTLILFISFLLLSFMEYGQSEPKAIKKDELLIHHSHQRLDPYYWMNQRDSKEVLDYIALENSYSAAYFDHLKPLQSKLLAEFEQRIDPNDVSSPYYLNGFEFQSKNFEKKDYEVTYILKNKQQVVFFDENERAANKNYYHLADWSLSDNNELLAFSEDHVGRRKYTIYFRNEKTRKLLKDEISDTDGSMVWANDNETIFYVRKDPETLREFQVYRHIVGTSSQKDALIFEEKDERFSVSISKTISKNYIIINTESTTTNEQILINANSPFDEYSVFLKRKTGHLYEVEDHEAGFFILSNENAPNKQVLLYKNWPDKQVKPETVIKHSQDVLIENKLTLQGYMVIETRTNGLQQIMVLNLKTFEKEKIEMKDETYSLSLGINDNDQAPHLFYSYNSMTTPYRVYKYHFESKKSDLFFEKKLIDSSFNPDNYESKRVWATANDGTKIPVSLVYKKGIDLKQAPLLLYGYGSYGVTIPAAFSATRLSIIDRGFVFAIAHVRGGKYLGEHWYESGKMLQKKNTFTDFIAAAEFLGKSSYCDPSKIYAQGGSAGGLLMGAIINLAPQIWKGVVAQVPFVDVVTTMLDESIPLTVGEYEEWGNPNEEEYYSYMLSYSPYDQVKKVDYPALYITTGYHDSQVQYWEPLKWVAKLRDYRTNKKPLLFDCNMDAGHGGGSGRTNERIEIAKEFSFILGLEGITE